MKAKKNNCVYKKCLLVIFVFLCVCVCVITDTKSHKKSHYRHKKSDFASKIFFRRIYIYIYSSTEASLQQKRGKNFLNFCIFSMENAYLTVFYDEILWSTFLVYGRQHGKGKFFLYGRQHENSAHKKWISDSVIHFHVWNCFLQISQTFLDFSGLCSGFGEYRCFCKHFERYSFLSLNSNVKIKQKLPCCSFNMSEPCIPLMGNPLTVSK